MNSLSLASLLLSALWAQDDPALLPAPPPPEPPDVLVELGTAWITWVDGEKCDGVYAVVPKKPGQMAEATFWSIPFHPGGRVPEEELKDLCDYEAILAGAIATKHVLEEQFQLSLAAKPVSGFLYTSDEGYALGTLFLDAAKRLTAEGELTEEQQDAVEAFTAVGKLQRVLLGESKTTRDEKEEASFVRNVDFTYSVRRFEIAELGPLPELPEDVPDVLAAGELDASAGVVSAALVGSSDVSACIDKIVKKTEVSSVALRVRVGPYGRVRKIRATGEDNGKRCFDRAVDGLEIDGWKEAKGTVVKVTVPAVPAETVPVKDVPVGDVPSE